MVFVGTFTVRRNRNAHHVRGQAVFWSYEGGDMRGSPVKRRGWLVCTNGPTFLPRLAETTRSGIIPIQSFYRTPQSTSISVALKKRNTFSSISRSSSEEGLRNLLKRSKYLEPCSRCTRVVWCVQRDLTGQTKAHPVSTSLCTRV